jgi:hypothetical protein
MCYNLSEVPLKLTSSPHYRKSPPFTLSALLPSYQQTRLYLTYLLLSTMLLRSGKTKSKASKPDGKIITTGLPIYTPAPGKISYRIPSSSTPGEMKVYYPGAPDVRDRTSYGRRICNISPPSSQETVLEETPKKILTFHKSV